MSVVSNPVPAIVVQDPTAGAMHPVPAAVTGASLDVGGPTPSSESIQLLHACLGHPSRRVMKEMIGADVLVGLDKFRLKESNKLLNVLLDCDACRIGKSKRLPFGEVREEYRASEKMDACIWHADCTGPINIPDAEKMEVLGSFRCAYLSVIVDEATHHVKVKALPTKSQVEEHIMHEL